MKLKEEMLDLEVQEDKVNIYRGYFIYLFIQFICFLIQSYHLDIFIVLSKYIEYNLFIYFSIKLVSYLFVLSIIIISIITDIDYSDRKINKKLVFLIIFIQTIYLLCCTNEGIIH